MSRISCISISKIYTLLLILFPLVSSYDLLGISPTLLFCFIESIVALLWIEYNHSVRIDNRIWIYLGYMLISATIGIIQTDQGSMYSFFIKTFFYFLSFFVFYVFSWQIIDFEYAVKVYLFISIVLSILVIVQFVFSMIGRGFSLVPPGLRLAGEDITSNAIRASQKANNRYSTVFLEPAHQCEYILPCLAILLFRGESERKGKDLCLAFLITIGFFCSTSSIGIFSAAILWTCFVLRFMKRRGASWLLYFLILAPVLVALLFFFLRFETISSNVLSRLEILDFRHASRSTGFRRIRYGWICYANLGTFQKIFGVGYKNFGYYLAKTGIGYKIWETNDIKWISYTNGITGMLIGLGLIGTYLNLRLFFWDCIKSKSSLAYGLLLTWGLIMFSSNSFDDLSGVMPMIFAMNVVFSQREMKNCLTITMRG